MSVITKYSYLCIITYINISTIFGLIPIKVPQTPCRDKFKYKFENNIWFGDINIDPPNYYYAVLETHFSINVIIPNGTNVGTLQFLETETTVVEKMKNRIPLNYRVYFPYGNILPYLTSLVLNGEVICTGPAEQHGTKYKLTHEYTLISSNENKIPRPRPFPNALKIREVSANPIPVVSKQQDSGTACGIIENQSFHPWLVGLFEPLSPMYKFYCSGSLISTKHVITAAHCTTVQFKIFVKLGSKDITSYIDSDSSSISRVAKDIYTHQDYDPEYSYSDISIILLNEEIAISPNIRPICLWPIEDDKSSVVGRLLQFVGWIPNGNPIEMNVIVNPLEECDKFDNKYISDKTICVSGESQVSGQCLGNSGGALIMSVNNRQILRGVASLTTIDSNPGFCNADNYYSLFTDIVKCLDWINFTLRLS